MSLTDLILIGLGAHRLWAIWLFLPWAERARIRWEKTHHWRDKLQWCEFCLSFWCGVIAMGVWLAPYGIYVLGALAAGGIVFTYQETQNSLKTFVLGRR